MNLSKRKIHDPYEGFGTEWSINFDNHSYSVVTSMGVSESLVMLEIQATAPFDTNRINTQGAEESVPSWFKRFGIRVGILFMQVGIEFYRTTTRAIGFDWELEDDWEVSDGAPSLRSVK
jgi:hypothetical protein